MREKLWARSNLVDGVFWVALLILAPLATFFSCSIMCWWHAWAERGALPRLIVPDSSWHARPQWAPVFHTGPEKRTKNIMQKVLWTSYVTVQWLFNFDCLDFLTMFWQRSFATNKVWVVLLVRVSFPKGKRVFCLAHVPTTSWLWWQKAGSTLKNQAILVLHSVAVGDDSWPKYASESWSLAVTGQNYK